MNNTLCWSCEKACGGCSWSDNLIPIKDWKATPTILRFRKPTRNSPVTLVTSYYVCKCPEYKFDNITFNKQTRAQQAATLGITERTLYRRLQKQREKKYGKEKKSS